MHLRRSITGGRVLVVEDGPTLTRWHPVRRPSARVDALAVTDVSAVPVDWARPRPLRRTTPAEVRCHSMAPGSTVAAACRFVEATGRVAGIDAIHTGGHHVRARAGPGRSETPRWA